MEIRRENYFENEYAKIWLENGIIFTVWAPNTFINLDIAKKIVEERLKITNKITRPGLGDARNAISMDKDAREYLSKGDSIKYVNAGAILINNKLQNYVANIFLKINRPPIPAKLFIDKSRALEWLQQFK